MVEPVVFQDQEQVYYADSCEPLKEAAERGDLWLRGWGRGNYPGRPLPTGTIPELRSVGVWDASKPQSWGLDTHCNEGIELTYVARGATPFEVDGRTWPLRQGDLTITRPWQFHRVGDPHIGSSRLIWLILDVGVRRPNQPWQWPDWLVCEPADLDALTTLLRHNEQPVWVASPQIARCFAQLDELLVEETPHALPAKLALRTNDLLLAILEMLQERHIALDAHLATSQRTVAMFLAELPRYAEKSWTLDSMAAQCGLSRSQFADYCKQITNMTPIAYLNSCRVKEAARLLRERPSLSITEAAFASGFNSSQYFATVFKAHTGQTPQRYRQESTGNRS